MSDQRDVVLITVDSLRADHCGFMGYDRDTTPTIDELAASGLVFENAISPAPETNSAVATFLTGHYSNPHLESDISTYTERTRQHMRIRRTVQQQFKEMGYTTAAVTANPWTSRYFDFDLDFDHFEDTMDDNLSKGLVEGGSDRGIVRDAVAQLLNWWQGQDMFMSWESLYGEIQRTLESLESPYFLWIFLVDVHMPYLPGKRRRTHSRLITYPANLSLFVGKYDLPFQSLFHDVLIRSYDDAIRYTDDFVARFLNDLDDDPLLVITSDHGECFGEDGLYGHGPAISEEALHVPFVVTNGPTGRVDQPFTLRQLPEFLTTLAKNEPYESVFRPIVYGRNYDPAIVVRGNRWRYEWRPTETILETRTSETDQWDSATVPKLEELGQELVDSFVESERERGRIHTAAKATVADASL